MSPDPAPNLRRLATSLGRWFDRWVHADVHGELGLVRQKIRVQVVVAWVGVVVFGAGALASLILLDRHGAPLLLGLFAAEAVACLAVIALQRVSPRHDLSGNVLALVTFSFGAIATACTGGLASPLVFWLPMTPLLAFVSVGSGAAFAWLVASLVIAFGAYIADLAGVPFPDLLAGLDPRLLRFTNVLALAIVMFAVAFAWEQGQLAAIQDLEEARDRARAADQAKSNLVAIVSHELRTPMNGVLGMLDLLRDTPLDATQLRYADTARGAARSLLDILDDLLDRSRIDAGRLDLDEVPFRVSDVLRSIESLVELGGFGRSVPVRFLTEGQVDSSVVGDPRRLRQVLTNLVGNALKFTDEGQVVVRARGEPGSERLRLELQVSDTGIGIPADRLPHVFDAFTQADGSITRRYGGTGLGLSITRDLVRMMGGTIEVESRVGVGTTFTVRLALPHADRAAPEVPPEPLPPRAWYPGMRVLVAEDNATNQMVIRGYLQRHGIQPDVVEDGAAAVEAALRQPYDLVLMDCEMPVLDGFQATETLRRRAYRGPIVALTAHASNKVRTRCLEAGMDGFLTKPLATAALVRVLHQYADGRTEPVVRPSA